MCMIAYRPVKQGKRGSNIPNDVIDRAMSRHPDGFGVAWREFVDGVPTLCVEKFGPAEKSAFRAMLKRVDAASVEYVAHFRFATQGPSVTRLAHPYEYNDPIEGKVLVFHNGIIDIKASASESDTEVFVNTVLAQLPSAWWRDPALRFLVNGSISWSKLVVMTATETVNLHEGRGDWDGGLWYSSEHKAHKYEWKGGKGGTSAVTNAALVPYSGNAAASAKVLDPLFADDSEDNFGESCSADGSMVHGKPRVWQPEGAIHMGHRLTHMVEFDMYADRDYEQMVVCDDCHTVGDAYVIDGQVWYDIAHRSGEEVEAEDANAALAVEAEDALVAARLASLN